MRKRASRRALYGWVFYTPPVLLIVGVLAFDAYLNIETRRNDYEVAKLKQHAGELNEKLDKLRSHSAATEQLQKLQEQALLMGLREPEPWQIERVAMPGALRPASDFQVARVIPLPPELPKHKAPEPVNPVPAALQAPAPAEPIAPISAPEAVASVPVEAQELPLLESMPEHVAQLSSSEATADEKPANRTSERAPLADSVASHADGMELSVSADSVGFPTQEEMPASKGAQASLDDSVESMLAL